VGNFIAFFDLAMGLAGPVVGLAVAHLGTIAAFPAGLLACLLALGVLALVSRGR
jgi:hypothetical protein